MVWGVRDVSIHQGPRGGEGPANAPVQGRVGTDRDACLTLNARKRGNEDELVVAS
jgi:hypothetical protein